MHLEAGWQWTVCDECRETDDILKALNKSQKGRKSKKSQEYKEQIKQYNDRLKSLERWCYVVEAYHCEHNDESDTSWPIEQKLSICAEHLSIQLANTKVGG